MIKKIIDQIRWLAAINYQVENVTGYVNVEYNLGTCLK